MVDSIKKSAKFYKEIYEARPWYHDFSSLGVQTYFPDDSAGIKKLTSDYSIKYMTKRFISEPAGFIRSATNLLSGRSSKWCEWALQNQAEKEKFILPYLDTAIRACKEGDTQKPSVLEMFCADGYYSFWMSKNYDIGGITAVDLDERSIQLGRIMNSVLKENIDFKCMDVFDLPPDKKYDVILCAGGLYHLADPKKLLNLAYEITTRFLVIQTVITLESEDKDYFVRPAPGWKHGSRFTDAGLRSWIDQIGFKVVKHGRNELRGNERLSDRGSTYYLCEKVGS